MTVLWIRSWQTTSVMITGSYQYETPEGTEYTNGTLTMATNAEFEPWEYKRGIMS